MSGVRRTRRGVIDRWREGTIKEKIWRIWNGIGRLEEQKHIRRS